MFAENLKKKLGLLLTLVLLFTAALAVMAPCVASAAGEVTLTTASTIVPADSLFYLEVSAPGASKIYLEHRNPQSSRWNEEEYKSADGETATFEEQWGQSRVFRAKAIINGTEYFSDIVTIEVTMLGMLETPAYVYPTTVVDGEDYVITWEDVPEAGYYVFDLFAYAPTTGSRSRIWCCSPQRHG